MKEKRRGNWYDKHKKGLSVILFLVIWISSCIVTFILIGGIQVLDAYDEKAYNPLIEAAELVVSKDSFDLKNRPDGIECTVRTCEDVITLTFFYEGQEYEKQSPHVIVKLREQSKGNGYDKISQARNYSSKSDFLRGSVPGFVVLSVFLGSIIGCILYVIVSYIIDE